MDTFETLPEEIVKLPQGLRPGKLKFSLGNFFSMNYDSILQFCNTNKNYSKYCFDEKFWEEYVKYNYDASLLLQKQRIKISTEEYFHQLGKFAHYDEEMTDVQMNDAHWLKLRKNISNDMTGSWRMVDWENTAKYL
jgi:hypothetical protein